MCTRVCSVHQPLTLLNRNLKENINQASSTFLGSHSFFNYKNMRITTLITFFGFFFRKIQIISNLYNQQFVSSGHVHMSRDMRFSIYVICATSISSDQHAHTRRLIRARNYNAYLKLKKTSAKY